MVSPIATPPSNDGTSVTVVRDVDGVAHVRSADVAGMFRGQGWAAAQDRLWQMEFDRRRAAGRLAEIVGSAALASDRFHRRMGFETSARASLAVLGDEAVTALSAYADGVNRYLSGDATLPPEFALVDAVPEPWEPWHSVALYQLRHLAMGTYETKVWRSGLAHRLGPDAARLWASVEDEVIDPDGDPVTVAASVAEEFDALATTLASFDEDAASNNLVIGPDRTATGRPLLAGDPHRAIDLPNVYWPNHVTCTDPATPIDAMGLSFPGVPGYPHFGHTQDVAWCITHGMADDQDVYLERLRRTDGVVEYHHDGAWHAADVRHERFGVAGADEVVDEVILTPNGPVVAGSDTAGLALRWTALAAPDTTFDALVPMLRAGSISDLDRAFVPWVVPVNNVLMADTTGAIAYRMRGRLAIREAENGWTVVPGEDPGRGWAGFVDDADLPRFDDPATGFLVTSNNRITAPDDGPYVSHDWAHSTRARRLTERLGDHDGWGVEEVAALLCDTHSAVAAAFVGRLQALMPMPSQPAEAAAVALLVDWDHHMDAVSAPAALYGTIRAELVGMVGHDLGLTDDRLPGVGGPSLHQSLRFINARLAFWIHDHDLVSDDALRSALRLAVRRLELTQGTDARRWRWGAAHTALFVHPLATLRPDLADSLTTPPSVELGGDNECVWATSTAPPTTAACNGQVARYVFDVGDWDESRWVLPHGVSGNPRSPHHLDLVEDWASGGMRPMRWTREAIDAASASVTTLD